MSKKIYVGNLPFKYRNHDLSEIFSKFGEIEDAVVVLDHTTRRSKGFGFVTFVEDVDAEKAITEMNGEEAEGRPLTVNEARPRKESNENKKEPSKNFEKKESEKKIDSEKKILNEPEENVTSEETREKPEEIFEED